MAGSEKFGPEHATPDLFVGCVTMIQTSADVDANAHEAIRLLWEGVGARVIEMEPALHDAIAARTSHVPHVVASALAQLGALGIESHRDKIRALIGNGFRDVTRIAASRAEVWRDICLTNSDAVLAGLDEVISALTQIRNDVAGGDGDDIEMFFDRGRECREILLQNGSDEQDVEP